MSRPTPALRASTLALLVLAASPLQAAPGWRPPGGMQGGRTARRPPLDFEPLHPRNPAVLSTPVGASVAVTASGDVVSLGEDGVLERTGADGHARWDILLSPSDGAPALSPSGACYVASRDAQLFSVDELGRLRWVRALGARPAGGVAIMDGLVMVALQNGQVAWFSARDGACMAHTAIGARPAAGAARAPDRTVVVPTSAGELLKIDGHGVLWRARLGKGAVGPVAIDGDGASYAVIGHEAVARVEADGTLTWRAAIDGALARSPALSDDGVLYVPTEQALVALDAKSGQPRWKARLDGTLVGGPLVADDGTVYVSAVRRSDGRSGTGVAVVIDRAGRVTDTIRLPAWPMPGLTLSNHRLWVGLRDATLLGAPVAAGALASGSPWPKARGDLRNSGARAEPAQGVE